MSCAIAVVLSFAVSALPARADSCTNLSYDLYSGLQDSRTDLSVSALQKYLVSTGYLSAAPTGYFGPSTLAAVKSFQGANGISVTGRAGPLTRSIIKQKSCATAYIPVAPANDQTASVGASITSNPAITLPASGSQLTIGKTYAVAWNQAPSYMYSLILQSQSGSGEGYILKDQTGSTQYAWQAGRVYSSALSDYTNVATGTYRVRLIQPSKGMTAADPVSGWFTLSSPPLSISTMSPGYAQNNNRTSVVLYGSGFTTSSTVRFDGIYGPYASILYVSPDGTVIVFSVPSGISPGIHPVMVVDPSGSTSNVQSLSVSLGSN